MFHRILVPLDGSAFGEQALPMAVALGRRSGAEVEIVQIHVPAPLLYIGGEFAGEPAAEAAIRELEQGYLDGVVHRVKASTSVTLKSTHLVGGSVGEALADHLRATHADLVVMTTHGRGPLSRLWLGSIADQFVRQSDVPVMLVRPRDAVPDFAVDSLPRRVLVPVDGSPLAEDILEPAAELAKLMQSDVLLLRVIQPALASCYAISAEGINAFGNALLRQLEEQEEAARKKADEYLEGAAQRLRSQGLVVRTRVVCHEMPAVAILEQTEADAADWIAMETHGRRGLARVWLGSVADKVLRGASIPMLLQRPNPAPAIHSESEMVAKPAAPPAAKTDRFKEAEVPGDPGCFHGQTRHTTTGLKGR